MSKFSLIAMGGTFDIIHQGHITLLSTGFEKEVIHSFKVIRPYFDYMSSVLTTNLNGESIL